MSLDANTLSLGAEDSKLEVLGEVVDDHEQDIVDYLESLLDYQYCEECERRYAADDDSETCSQSDCDGKIRDATDEFGHLIEDALKNFDDRYITGYREYKQALENELSDLKRRNSQLGRDQRRAGSDERAQIMRQRRGLKDRIQVLGDYL